MSSASSELNNRSFTDHMYRRLFWPTLFSTLGLALGDIADALFVGIRIGPAGLATMSLVAPVYMIYNVLDIGIAVGASVHFTRALGRGKAKEGIGIFSQMVAAAAALSVLIAAAGLLLMPLILRMLGAGSPDGELWRYANEYLRIMFLGAPLTFFYFLLYYCVRCDDDEKLASAGFLAGYLTDVAASAVFVLVLEMDVRGAILATVLGKAVGICVFLFHFRKKWAILRFTPVKPDLKQIFTILKTGMSSSFGYIGQFAALLIVNNLLLRIGGESALAQFNVVQNVSYLALAIYSAVGDTLQPLCGTFYAEHNRDAVRRVMAISVFTGAVAGSVIAALFSACAPSVCALFGLTGSAVTEGAFAVRMFCLSSVPAGLNVIWSACFQSGGREKMVFLINQLRTFVLFILFALILSPFGTGTFFLTFLGAELGTLAVWTAVWRLNRPPETEAVFSYLLGTGSRDIRDLLEKAEAFSEENGATPQQMYFVSMCVEEVCEAIIENAFTGRGDEYIQMTLAFENDGTAVLHLRDNAVDFNPFAMNTGRDYDNAEHLASLGIQMVKAKSKRFFYRRYAGFNTLTVEV